MNKTILAFGLLIGLTQCKTNNVKEVMSESPKAFDINDMDTSKVACDDFYQYAIGNWKLKNPVPNTESSWMAFNILHEANKVKLQEILDETSKNTQAKKGTDAQLIRDFYKSALDTAKKDELGLAPIKDLFELVEGIKNHADLSKVFGAIRPLGIGSAVGIYVTVDRKNSNAYTIGASQTGLSLPDRSYYLNNDDKMVDIRNTFVEHIDKMFGMADMSSENAGQRVLDLETALATISWPKEELRIAEKTYNKFLIKDWDAGLKNIDIQMLMSQSGFPTNDSIVVGQPSFYLALDQLIPTISIEDWKNWMRWNIIDAYAPGANTAFEKANFEFYSKKLSGVKEMKTLKERVLERVDGNLGEPLGKLFVEKHFPPDSKAYVASMIEDLRAAYKASIESLDWMGDSTKTKALKKLASFTYKIGYPDKWEDYSSIDIKPDSYLRNLVNIRQFGFNLMLEKLKGPVDKSEWHMNPQMVNAYYNPVGNEVVFPAGILQPPFFHTSFDHAINYGGIGAVIGHEFTHGFDDQGSKYDWDGNMNNWWTEDDRRRFDSLANNLVEQFNAIEALPGVFVNGKMTLGENIADLGGLTLAYEALKRKLGNEAPAPIDGFTWQQRFFLGWANVWKGNMTEEALRNRLLTDYHSPAEYRVSVPTRNIPAFLEAFSCQNPDFKGVKIW
jgi:putative endopeptidase